MKWIAILNDCIKKSDNIFFLIVFILQAVFEEWAKSKSDDNGDEKQLTRVNLRGESNGSSFES
jgi:hypothetical protein